MKNKVYKLLLPMLLVTSFGAMKAGELPVKPIAPKVTSFDVFILYNMADTFAGLGFNNLAIATRDTAKILGDSFLYWSVKAAALIGLAYQVDQAYQKNSDNKTLFAAWMDIALLATYFSNFLGNSWAKVYGFAPAPNA
jgi:hypothetical protein